MVTQTPETVALCINAAYTVPAALFVGGAIVTALYLKARHGLRLGETLLVLFGARRVAFGRLGSALMLASLFVPMALLFLRVGQCSTGAP